MRFERTRFVAGLVALAAAGLLAPAVQAQTSTGAIAGSVTDGTAALPGVAMTVNNAATGFTRTTVTDSSGSFRFAALPVGKYSVKAELSGFATVKVEGIQVDVATTRTIEVTMKPSKVAEQVTVTAEAPLIESSPAIGTVVSQNELQTLPLNGRQFRQPRGAGARHHARLQHRPDQAQPARGRAQRRVGAERQLHHGRRR